MKVMYGFFLVLIVFKSLAAQAASEELPKVTTTVIDSSLGLVVKGNNELPNVLYIVPWKKGASQDVSPIQGRIVDEVYGPLEYQVFQRELKLYRQFNNSVKNDNNLRND